MGEAALAIAALSVVVGVIAIVQGNRRDQRTADTTHVNRVEEYAKKLEDRLDKTERECKDRIGDLEEHVARLEQERDSLEREKLRLLERLVGGGGSA